MEFYIICLLGFVVIFLLGVIFGYFISNLINTKELKNMVRSASDLAKILTSNQNLKGQFGEECLEEVIKTAYPEENLNYLRQYITKNKDNNDIKPDYLIRLPEGKSVFIDCKLNLEKFIKYKENPKQKSLKSDFIKDMNNTINTLSNKKYQSAKELNQPDFILMYIPLEPVITHLYTDSDFYCVIKNAMQKNIIITGNSGILTALRLIKLLWVKTVQNENVENVIDLAQYIYNYATIHAKNLSEIKKTLDEAHEKFLFEYNKVTQENKFFKSIETLRHYGIESASDKK